MISLKMFEKSKFEIFAFCFFCQYVDFVGFFAKSEFLSASSRALANVIMMDETIKLEN